MQPLEFKEFGDMTRWWPEILGTATGGDARHVTFLSDHGQVDVSQFKVL
jgi:hypothetical protein